MYLTRSNLLNNLLDNTISGSIFISDGLAQENQLHRQGSPMDLMQLVVKRRVVDTTSIPERLLTSRGTDLADAVRERIFTFTSGAGQANQNNDATSN
jgi:hypothetical protein